MPNSIERRVNPMDFAELKSSVTFMTQTISEIKEAVNKNNDAAADFRVHATGEFSTINQKLVAFIDYQQECDADRVSQGVRMESLEHWKSRQAGQVSILLSVAAGVGVFLGAAWSDIKELFKHLF